MEQGSAGVEEWRSRCPYKYLPRGALVYEGGREGLMSLSLYLGVTQLRRDTNWGGKEEEKGYRLARTQSPTQDPVLL